VLRNDELRECKLVIKKNEQRSSSPAENSGIFEESRQMVVETGSKVQAPPTHQIELMALPGKRL
jgi:hypothetical protein